MGQSTSLAGGGGQDRKDGGLCGGSHSNSHPHSLQLPSTIMGDGVHSGGVHSVEKESTGKAYGGEGGERGAARPLEIRPASPSRRLHKSSDGLTSFGLGIHPFQEASPDRKLHPPEQERFL